jgi:hypothetical protein
MQREKNRTENSILEYMKKSTMRRVNEEDTMQREIAELNRLKQIKNRKYSWPGQLAVYSQPVEVTLYLTVVLVQLISEILGESYAPIQCMLMIQILVFIVFPRIEIV